MPGKVGVKIKAGRNLPVMDRGSDTTDAYVEIKLGSVTHKTDVCRKSLNPQWNTDWFRFEVDDAELQDEPLQIRLMDHDTYSANDAIGKVNISLNPLCLENAGQSNQGKGAVMSGWIPVFDTMHGIRGEVNIIVKVDLFSDVNRFRQSSCGVQFFHSTCIPHGYRAQIIHGFVEELVVNDDPEYQWIDKIRTPRASNEARQVVFLRLSGQVQRKIGLKAINLGANAVIGYTQCFDLEGDVGVVARGIGTAVTLVKIQENSNQMVVDNALIEERTKKYLEFLSNSFTDSDEKFDSDDLDDPLNAVYKILGLDQLDRTSARSPKIILKKRWKPSAKDATIYEENLTDTDYSVKQLLEQEDMREEKPHKKFHHHIKKITHQSKNLISDKVSNFRTKYSHHNLHHQQKNRKKSSKALHGSYSDVSISESLRSSFSDIRNFIGFSKIKNKKPVKNDFHRSVSDGSNMATLLVSSVLRGPSLNSISEHQDATKYILNSVNENNRNSESTTNLITSHKKFPKKEIMCESLSDIENIVQLNLHDRDHNHNESSYTSISSISASCSSTSEEGFSDELSEATTPNEIIMFDPDTVSMVVKTVLAKEMGNIEDSNVWIQPGSTQDSDIDNLVKIHETLCRKYSTDSSSSSVQTVAMKNSKDSNKIKHSNSISNKDEIHSITTGATRILNKDSKNSENIIENQTNYEKLGNLLKNPSLDEDSDNWIEPGSTTNEPETIDNSGKKSSILYDLKDNITGKFHYLQEHIHMPHLLDSKTKKNQNRDLQNSNDVKSSSKNLVKLNDNNELNSDNLTNENVLQQNIPDISSSVDTHNNETPTTGKRRFSIDLIIKTLHLPIHHHHNHPEHESEDSNKLDIKNHHETSDIHNQKHRHSEGLLGTAMRSMLMETLNFAEEIGHEQNKSNNPNAGDFQSIEIHKEKFYDGTITKIKNDNDDDDDNFKPKNKLPPLIGVSLMSENNSQENTITTTNIIPKAIVIHPSSPTPSPDSFNSFIHPSFDQLFLNVSSKITYNNNKPNIDNLNNSSCHHHLDQKIVSCINSNNNNNINNNNNNNNINNNNNNNDYNNSNNYYDSNLIASNNHENNNCSSLDTFYLSSSTNKAHTLIPSAPSSIQQQLRSSTELALSSTTNGGTITSTVANSTSNIQSSQQQVQQPPPQQLLQQQQPEQLKSQIQQQQSNFLPTQHHQHNNCGIGINQSLDVCIKNNLNIKGEPLLIHNSIHIQPGHTRAESVGTTKMSSPVKICGINSNNTGSSHACNNPSQIVSNNKNAEIFRRSSDSDLSVTPKGNSICVASDRLVAATTMMRLNAPLSAKIATTAENLDMLEYPFLTLAKYPVGFILHLGATVAARSVKLLERVPNLDEPETRDSWWTEIRMEIRSHARALGCNVILGYSEVTTISDDVCVLSATGTAAVINMSYSGDSSQFDIASNPKKDPIIVSSLDERECIKEGRSSIKGSKEILNKDISSSYGGTTRNYSNTIIHNRACGMCHVPYTTNSVPVNVKMIKCAICKRGKVPDVLMATIEIPECLQITGRGCFVQAQVLRTKKDLRSESNAKEISDGLPFLEYELHRLLINKLKAKGMNAVFGLKTQIAVGEKMMALIATGTAVFLSALPPPTVPKIVAGNSWNDDARLNDLQKSLQETVEKNREIYQLKNLDPDIQQNGKQSDTDESDDELLELDLNAGNKDTCVLEVDDIEDLEIIKLLMEQCPPDGFHIVNTQAVPGLQDMEVVRNLQMFTQVWRAKISVGQNTGHFPKHFQRLLQTIYFKLRTMIPCAVCDLKFQLELPESDEIQILVTGMTLGLGEPKVSKQRRKVLALNNQNTDQIINTQPNKKTIDDDLIFSLDEDHQNTENSQLLTCPSSLQYGSHSLKLKKNSPSRAKFCSVRYSRHLPLHERYGVDITPLSYIPGGKIEKYLGNLNFFFIRESTSIRENGGISGFVHGFITELLAVVRSHVSALGGNAMVSFYMTELILVDNQHKNQGQCLISIGGDVVYVSYFADD